MVGQYSVTIEALNAIHGVGGEKGYARPLPSHISLSQRPHRRTHRSADSVVVAEAEIWGRLHTLVAGTSDPLDGV